MPIDKMLIELRSALEAFEDAPSDEAFAHLQREMLRIACFCEDFWWGGLRDE